MQTWTLEAKSFFGLRSWMLLDRENQFGVVECLCQSAQLNTAKRWVHTGSRRKGECAWVLQWVMATPRCPLPSVPAWPWMELPCSGMVVSGLVLQGKVHSSPPCGWRLTLGGWDGLCAPHPAQMMDPSHIRGRILLSHICCPPGMLEKNPILLLCPFLIFLW